MHVYVSQVCPPGLHITLGVFYRLWCLLETDCHKLDLELATRISPSPADPDSFKKHSALLKELGQLSENKDSLAQLLSSLNSVLGDLTIQFSNESHPLVETLKGVIESHAQNLNELVHSIRLRTCM